MSVRWLLLSMLTLLAIASAIGVVQSRQQHRDAFAQLSRLGDAGRIQEQAANRLQMRAPVAADVVVVVP